MAKKQRLTFRAYAIIDRAVEEGITRGWNRAHKHMDDPSVETIKDCINMAVMEQLNEVIEFGE